LILERTKYSMQKSEFDKYLKWASYSWAMFKAYYQNARKSETADNRFDVSDLFEMRKINFEPRELMK